VPRTRAEVEEEVHRQQVVTTRKVREIPYFDCRRCARVVHRLFDMRAGEVTVASQAGMKRASRRKAHLVQHVRAERFRLQPRS